jgi:hypothetical protein
MTCRTYEGGVTVCTPPRTLVRRRILTCWNCETKRRVAQVYQGIWYADHFYCCHCGDGWGDGERMERPFQRGWRERAIKAARGYWDQAVSAEEFQEHMRAELQAHLRDVAPLIEDVVEDL